MIAGRVASFDALESFKIARHGEWPLESKAFFNFNWERLAARRSLTGEAGHRHHEMIAGRVASFDALESFKIARYGEWPRRGEGPLGSKAFFNFNWERLAARRSLTGKAGHRHHEMIAGRVASFVALESFKIARHGEWPLESKAYFNFIGSALRRDVR